MKLKFKNTVFILLLVFSANSLLAQSDCLLVLKKVQKDYDEGIIEKIPEEIADCIKSGLAIEDRVTAYKLLINVYLFDDRVALAEEMMEELLTFEPEMKPNEAVDSKEFITLFNSYRTIPLYTFGVSGGINYSQIGLIKEFGTYNTDLYDGKYTAPDFGLRVGINFSYLIKNNFYAHAEALFITHKFNYLTNLDTSSTLEFNENQNIIQVPLTISYHFGKKKVRPTIKLGGYVNYNFSTKTEFFRPFINNEQPSITGPNINVSSMRSKINYGLIGSLGVKYKVKEGYWFLDAGYSYSLSSAINPKERYSNSELLYEYHYVDDDFKVSNMFVSIGYKRLFYKPKKLKIHE